jgi:hypothetical protein
MDINLEQHKKHYMESDKRAYMNLYIAYMNLNQHEKLMLIYRDLNTSRCKI